MFSKVLVANRGEIAVRIIRACREMGITSVAVYSEADRESMHVALADESICIGGPEPSDSYLRQDRIISAAIISGAQAIHPGYGFLSENPDFAELCLENGIVFIGPHPEIMRKLGSKEEAKAIAEQAGLPVIPGCGIVNNIAEAKKNAERIGYPVMLKAAAGGGGRGIRLINTPDELADIYPTASAEAEAAFGDRRMYLEKFIPDARHIELQLLADEDGNVVCLGDRDCTIQKNNQKLIEESPSPYMTEECRKDIIEKTISAVAKMDYSGAGTVEFLMDRDGNMYFMEMNLRLQVEHGVSEMRTGVDLVKWQIRIAAGITLSFNQKDIVFRGHSIECRISAVSPGRITFIHEPGGPQVRADSSLTFGTEISMWYDPLIEKIMVCAADREEAIRKMKAALCELVIEGVPTNHESQLQLLDTI